MCVSTKKPNLLFHKMTTAVQSKIKLERNRFYCTVCIKKIKRNDQTTKGQRGAVGNWVKSSQPNLPVN